MSTVYRSIRGVKASASLKRPLARRMLDPDLAIRGVKASASLKRGPNLGVGGGCDVLSEV